MTLPVQRDPVVYGKLIYEIQQCVFKAFLDLKLKPYSLNGWPTPNYNVTLDGFMLEFYYGSPHCLHTPFGKYDICGGCVSRGCRDESTVVETLEDNGLQLKLHKAGVQTKMGYFGPFYIITGINGDTVPEYSPVTKDTPVDVNELPKLWEAGKHSNRDENLKEWEAKFESIVV